MGAKVICDAVGLPQAPDYYTMYGTIPTSKSSSIKVDGSVGHLGNNPFRFLYLVKGILLKVKNGDDLCIVCHGNTDRVGIFTNGESWLHHSELNELIKANYDVPGNFGLDITQWRQLLDDLQTVRGRRIGHIAVRACRIGQDRTFLKKLAFVLGADSISAPILKTAYLKPHYYGVSTEAHKKSFATAFPKTFVVPMANNKSVTLGSYELSNTQFKAGIAADSDQTLGQFYRENFPGSPTLTKSQLASSEVPGFPLHGFCVRGEKHKFYFPNDPRYVSNLTYVTNCRFAYV